jgi:hypothetical protein
LRPKVREALTIQLEKQIAKAEQDICIQSSAKWEPGKDSEDKKRTETKLLRLLVLAANAVNGYD